MTTKTTRFDAMRYLDTEQDHVDLLNDALATNDPRVIVHTMQAIARAKGMTDLAKATGISRSSLYAALADDGNPTLETFTTILGALRLQLHASGLPAEAA